MGLQVGAKGARKEYRQFLTDSFTSMTQAPLKPQQRMYILRANLIPRMFHGLVLAEQTSMGIEALDRLIRSSIRTWLGLPHDTPVNYFHESVQDGGLSISRLRYMIPLLRRRRLNNLLKSNDPVIQSLVNKPLFSYMLRKCEKKTTIDGTQLSNTTDLRKHLKESLLGSVDGKGLRYNCLVPRINNWVVDGTSLLTGSDYRQAVKVRCNLLPTRMSSNRGPTNANIMCDAGCNAREALSHISQSCTRTHPLRVARHDSILNYIEEKCVTNKIGYIREPPIKTEVGIRRPDLIVIVEKTITVLDLTITADHVSPLIAFNQKCAYYNRPQITTWAQSHFKLPCPVEYSAIVLNWRGAILTESSTLMKKLGIIERDQTILSIRCLTFTSHMHKHFHRSPTRQNLPITTIPFQLTSYL